jgi:hypothetical protein
MDLMFCDQQHATYGKEDNGSNADARSPEAGSPAIPTRFRRRLRFMGTMVVMSLVAHIKLQLFRGGTAGRRFRMRTSTTATSLDILLGGIRAGLYLGRMFGVGGAAAAALRRIGPHCVSVVAAAPALV